MPTRCTEAATCSGIRNSGSLPTDTHAGKPDRPDRTSGLEPVSLSRPSRTAKSPKPECAPFAPKMPFAFASSASASTGFSHSKQTGPFVLGQFTFARVGTHSCCGHMHQHRRGAMQIEHRAAGTFHEAAARRARSMAGRLQALAGVCISPFGPISLIAPCLKISLGAVGQEHLPCVLEIRAGFFEGCGGVRLMFGWMRGWIETAAPFPRIGIVRIADALGNRPDMNIAVIRNRCASSYGGGLRIGGA